MANNCELGKADEWREESHCQIFCAALLSGVLRLVAESPRLPPPLRPSTRRHPSRALRRHGERASGEPRRRSRVDEVGVRGLCSPTAVIFSSTFQDPRAAAPVHAHRGGALVSAGVRGGRAPARAGVMGQRRRRKNGRRDGS